MSSIKKIINFEDFLKLDIRIGTVIECLNVEKSNKLLCLKVDFGDLGVRQILTGLAQWYSANDFVEKQFPFVLNLEPRKIMGLESQGMILGIGLDHTLKPTFLHPAQETKNGEGVN